ncbi:hypothetical protein HanXRQr2_Chr08g0320001 [Helianthus annuus]|uniref:Uncharacterized protein n=1 Tax=Helianthus annuus TaxID=4232 RepID=A0A9K3ICP0_HELAN|nr:hypothetical protein HanXRQr2_Chr08g0320001 [Helianthus annuus]KAJ0537489.1 hypothetical protein HanHA300_Chr08g0264001 [Helianthus annuus]KAJ0552077.1 hypothetical protein HanHA89_Chr08g0280851 [Helianthus annuus]
MTSLTNVFQSIGKLCTKLMDRKITTCRTRVVIPMEPVDFFMTPGTQTSEVLFCIYFILVLFLVFFMVFVTLQLFRPQICKI